MAPILPLIMSLVGQNQKDQENQKQNEVSSYLGKMPTEQPAPAAGMMDAVNGMMQKAPEGKKPMGAMQMVDLEFGKPQHGEPDGDEDLLA